MWYGVVLARYPCVCVCVWVSVPGQDGTRVAGEEPTSKILYGIRYIVRGVLQKGKKTKKNKNLSLCPAQPLVRRGCKKTFDTERGSPIGPSLEKGLKSQDGVLLRRAYLDPKEPEREVSSDIKSPFAGHDMYKGS